MSDEGITPELFNSVSQNAHWAGGLAWIWGSIILFGPQYIWYFLGAGTLIAAWKEFWYDERYETTEVRGSSLEDFAFYCVGLFGATLLYWLRVKFFGAS